jgi:dihydroorotate dehydrogenase
LQSQRRLAELLEAIEEEQAAREARGAARRPLLVKLAPDLSEDDFQSIVDVALDHKVAGLIATNTTVERPNLRTPSPLASETGGLSGAPLASRSTAVIRTLHRCSAGRLPIIGVGGVFNADDAYEKLRAGASLVQIYSGFIYNGPGFPRDLCRGLRALLERDGLDNISQAIGRDA